MGWWGGCGVGEYTGDVCVCVHKGGTNPRKNTRTYCQDPDLAGKRGQNWLGCGSAGVMPGVNWQGREVALPQQKKGRKARGCEAGLMINLQPCSAPRAVKSPRTNAHTHTCFEGAHSPLTQTRLGGLPPLEIFPSTLTRTLTRFTFVDTLHSICPSKPAIPGPTVPPPGTNSHLAPNAAGATK